MATSPVQFFPTQPRPSYKIWLPVLCGLMVICFESTPQMGGSTTGKWLTELWPRMLAKWEPATFGLVHHLLRKLGHLTGYGTLGLLLRRAWHSSMRMYLKLMGSRLIFASSTLSVLFTFVVGCLDEWHQSILPGRSSSFRDVLIDTSGAILFNVIFWTVRLVRRRTLLRRQADLRRSTLLVSGI
jgi:VanZ family protein